MPSINYQKIIDLSHLIDQNIPRWAGDPLVELENVANIAEHKYYLRRFTMGEHSGTHLNAPNTFAGDRPGIDSYQPQSLVVPAVVIDIRPQVERDQDYLLKIDDLLNWEKVNQTIPDHTVILIYTGWQEKWQTPAEFLPQDAQGQYHFPGCAKETAEWLLTERKIAGIGIDTHGVDGGIDENFMTNRLILQNQGLVLENLNNLHLLPPDNITLVIGILKLKNGSGSPASVLAFVE
jgi:kynurenine formamidase